MFGRDDWRRRRLLCAVGHTRWTVRGARIFFGSSLVPTLILSGILFWTPFSLPSLRAGGCGTAGIVALELHCSPAGTVDRPLEASALPRGQLPSTWCLCLFQQGSSFHQDLARVAARILHWPTNGFGLMLWPFGSTSSNLVFSFACLFLDVAHRRSDIWITCWRTEDSGTKRTAAVQSSVSFILVYMFLLQPASVSSLPL